MNQDHIPRRPAGLPATIATVGILLATTFFWISVQTARSDDKPAGVLFSEGFDDARLFDRGWYDGEKFRIAPDGAFAGSGCIAFHWKADKSADFSGSRHLF